MDAHAHAVSPADAGRRTWAVAGISALAMLLEVGGGWRLGSVALTAEGLHMAAHVGVYAVAGLAWLHARRTGEGRAGAWAALVNAAVLIVLAGLIAVEAVDRLQRPQPVAFDLAIGIGLFGLAVNLVCAWQLGDRARGHAHHDGHGHAHRPHSAAGEDGASEDGAGEERAGEVGARRDLNLRAVYLHVLSDAATAVLALAGLIAGRLLGWTWTDAVAGFFAALLVGGLGLTLARQATTLLRG